MSRVTLMMLSLGLLLCHSVLAQQTTPSADRDADAASSSKAKESGRMFGVIPAFNVSGYEQVPSLTSQQKLSLALKSTIDPTAFLGAGIKAGTYQAFDWNPGFGQGASGFAKRFSASFGDGATGKMLGTYLLPSLLHQDPRYFRKGQGGTKSRLGYSLSRVVVTRTDAGKRAFNWSKTLSSVGSGAISNLYYPAEDRGAQLIASSATWSILSEAGMNVLKEFWPDFQRKFAKRKKTQDPASQKLR